MVSDEEDIAARIMAITGGAGARVVFDAVGGAPLAALLPAVAREGTVVVYGMLGGTAMEVPLPPLMLGNLTLRGWSADLFVEREDRRREVVAFVAGGLADGTLRPVVARTFPLDEIAQAHAYLESNAQIGKVVVTTRTAGQ